MTNSYGGESPAKKLARQRLWDDIRRMYGEGFPGARIMVLAGPEAADARVLRAHGVNASKIILVDVDREALESSARIVPGARTFHGSALDAAKKYAGQIDVIVMDYCAQLRPESVSDFARTASFALRRCGGIAAFGMSYGREIGKAAAAVARGRAVEAIVQELVRAKYDDEKPKVRSDMAQFRARKHVSCVESVRAFRAIGMGFRPEVAIGYVSRTDAKPGTPMIYVAGKAKRGAAYRPDVLKATQIRGGLWEIKNDMRARAVEIARVAGSETASDLMNLDAGTVRAWLALANRASAEDLAAVCQCPGCQRWARCGIPARDIKSIAKVTRRRPVAAPKWVPRLTEALS